VDRVLQCDCGFEARAADENELVATVRRHALEAHGMTLSQEEASLLASRAELGPLRVAEASAPGKEEE
jgi:hypothetical protein